MTGNGCNVLREHSSPQLLPTPPPSPGSPTGAPSSFAPPAAALDRRKCIPEEAHLCGVRSPFLGSRPSPNSLKHKQGLLNPSFSTPRSMQRRGKKMRHRRTQTPKGGQDLVRVRVCSFFRRTASSQGGKRKEQRPLSFGWQAKEGEYAGDFAFQWKLETNGCSLLLIVLATPASSHQPNRKQPAHPWHQTPRRQTLCPRVPASQQWLPGVGDLRAGSHCPQESGAKLSASRLLHC